MTSISAHGTCTIGTQPDDKRRDSKEGHNHVLVLFMTLLIKGALLSGDATSGTSTLGLTPLFLRPFSLFPYLSVSAAAYLSGGADTETRDIEKKLF